METGGSSQRLVLVYHTTKSYSALVLTLAAKRISDLSIKLAGDADVCQHCG